MFEVDYEAYLKTSDLKIVEHFTSLIFCNFFDGFCVDYNLIKTSQIRHIFADFNCLINGIAFGLLRIGDISEFKFNNEGIFIYFLMQPVTNFI